MRYTSKRSLASVKAAVTLIYACMNLKKLVKWSTLHFTFCLYQREQDLNPALFVKENWAQDTAPLGVAGAISIPRHP